MMVHLEEGTLQALLDDELSEVEARHAEKHVANCTQCRAAFQELRRISSVTAAAFALLDSLPQPVLAGRPSPPSMRRTARWSTAPLRRAAILLLIFAAAASATIPGSPVRGWIAERLTPIPSPLAVSDAGDPPTGAIAPPAPAEAGVRVAPVDGRLRIVLNGATPDLQVRTLFTDSRLGGVYALGDSPTARFRTAQGLIEVSAVGGGELRVEIPYQVDAASLVIDGRTYLVKDEDRLQLEVPARDSSATEVLFQVQP